MKYLLMLMSLAFCLQSNAIEFSSGITHPYPYLGTPNYTGYSNPVLPRSGVINVRELSSLDASSKPDIPNDVISGDIYRVAVAGLVRSGSILSKKGAIVLKQNIYRVCAYSLSYLGKDKAEAQYFSIKSPISACSRSETIRIVKQVDGSYLVAGHSSNNGIEQWAGIFHKLKK